MIISDNDLSSLILQANIVSQEKLSEIKKYSLSSGVSLFDALIDQNIIENDALGSMIASFIKTPFISLSKVLIPDEVLRTLPERVARKEKIIPFERGNGIIKVAMGNPSNKDVINLLGNKTGDQVQVYFATERDIYNALRGYRKEMQATIDKLVTVKHGEKSIPVADAPIEEIVTKIIFYAYEDRASDIHIEPEEKDCLIRYRTDGILRDALILPIALHDQIVSRIKVLSRLRTDEHLSPQDGKMQVQLDEEDLDIRVSIVPVTDGEKVVMRLLASRYRQFSLLDLGMSEKDLKKVENAFNKSYGMVLSTGPTGSGKTTSIYAIIKILNTREKNITTIEDPVEYKIKGVNQIQVNSKTELTFANGLKSILRQDPNIIFVGEIRDNETAGIAVNAALTGHLVFSTLHTNDAATALPRMTDMKVEPFLVASTVNVIVAQRLIRKICDNCREPIQMNRVELIKSLPEEVITRYFGNSPQIKMFKGRGCKICFLSGYSGRIGIFEVLEVSNDIKELIMEKSDSDVIKRKAMEDGMSSMLDDGLQKVAKGLTTIEEVLRATRFE